MTVRTVHQHNAAHPLRSPFLARARSHPSETWALRVHPEDGPCDARTRGESSAIVAQSERQLAALGLRPGTLIGLLAAPGPAFLEALVAAWGAGLSPVLLDPSTTPAERAQLEARIGIGWRWDVSDGWSHDVGAPSPGAAEWSKVSASGGAVADAAVLKLTSGSTGPPRGIAVSARALAADTARLIEAMELTLEDRLLAAVPLTHSYGFSVLTAPTLMCGATLCFPGAVEVLEAARRLEATFLPSVPSWFRALLALTRREDLPASLRLLLSAGAPLSADTARGFRERLGHSIRVLYGASECGGIAYDGTGTATERGGVGAILPGVTIELGEPLPDGGRAVTVRSSAVANGYVPQEEGDTALLDGRRYVSEDLARVENGELFLMGRTSDWINVRAQKVNPREVEEVIAALAGVDEVVVHGVPAPSGREETNNAEEMVRAIVASARGTVTTRAVLDWCASRLAPHKRPRAVVILDALPRTARGKLDRARLLSLEPSGGTRPAPAPE